MGYYVADGLGDSCDAPTIETMREFLERIDPNDEEHGAAWLSDHSGRALEMNGDGTLVFSARPGPPRHMTGVSLERALELWRMLADGRVADIERQPWQLGSRPPLAPDELARREAELARWQLACDREFYDLLGEERANVPCRREGCSRGAIELSVLCRKHHFENIRDRPCPFTD